MNSELKKNLQKVMVLCRQIKKESLLALNNYVLIICLAQQ